MLKLIYIHLYIFDNYYKTVLNPRGHKDKHETKSYISMVEQEGVCV